MRDELKPLVTTAAKAFNYKNVYAIKSIYSLFKERIVTSQIFSTRSCIDSYNSFIMKALYSNYDPKDY